MSEQRPCPICHGTGAQQERQTCLWCDGSGVELPPHPLVVIDEENANRMRRLTAAMNAELRKRYGIG